MRAALLAFTVILTTSKVFAGVGDEGAAQSRGGAQGRPVKLEEVVVTAQKREERLQDVPIPVSVLPAEDLLTTNNTRIEDFYAQTPSLSFNAGGYGDPILSIRGVTTAGMSDNPTAAALIDDIPYTASVANGGTGVINPINIDPNDIEHIEVLRGPQGTLYGASAMGGLLKYVTIAPSTDSFSGRAQLGTNTYDAGGVGYQVRGAVNMPLGNEIAVRVSGFQALDPGYIDAHYTNGTIKKDFNDRKTEGGRLSTLWKPSDSFSIILSALYQKDDSSAQANSSISLPPYQVNTLVGTGPVDRTTQLYSAVISASVLGFDLKSTTGYLRNNVSGHNDVTAYLGGLASAVFGPGVDGSPGHATIDFSKVSEEIRASRSITSWLDWQVGGFYDHENADTVGHNYGAIPATGEIVGTLINDVHGGTFGEHAIYSTATVKFTNRFDVELGGRASWINNSGKGGTVTGALWPFLGVPSPIISVPTKFTDTPLSYSFTPRFKISPDVMVYGRIASGYRTGASGDPAAAAAFKIPVSYKPDTTINYEVGEKSTLLDGRLIVDGSIYYIDWRDMQTAVNGPIIGYVTNIGAAKSEGAELSVTMRPAKRTMIQGWVTWDDAVLTDRPQAATTGKVGDWLPFSRRISSYLALEQGFPLTAELTGSAGLSWTYAGKSYGPFSAGGIGSVGGNERQLYPAYSRFDIHVGVQYHDYAVNAYVNNLANKAAFIGGGIGTVYYDTYQYIKPREFGLLLTANF